MNVLHIVAGLPPAAAGLAEVVPRLAREIVTLGHEVTIATVATADEQLSAAAIAAEGGGVRIVRFAPTAPRSLYFSWEMRRGLHELVSAADLVHVHSNWTFPVWWACRTAARQGKPYVMSPHGCLDPLRLAHSAWKKRLVGSLDRRCLRQAAAIHATSAAERDWIRQFLGITAGGPQIDVIPNGVDLPASLAMTAAGAKPPDRERTILALGRLHPLKGLDLLLDAWALLGDERRMGRWRLVIAGPDEQGTRPRLEARATVLGLADVTFAGPVYGDDKMRLFEQADLVVLPSRSENFGVVVAEALAAGIPVVTTTTTPWAEINGRCGWCVEPAPQPLATALTAAMQLTDDGRAALGARGRELVAAKYQWTSVGRAMADLYSDLLASRG